MFGFPRILLFLVVVSLSPLLLATATNSDDESRRSYIIHVHPPPPEHKGTHRDWHESFLPDPSRLLHSYSHVLSGFSAELTQTELESIRNLEGFIHASPPTIHSLHTTNTPSFLHLNNNPSGFWAKSANYGKGAIIAILDTGIDPNHPSFNGSGFPPPPSKWNGTSSFNLTTAAKNKLIGGRTFKNGTEISSPPIDDDGHGTYVAGTAAGRFVCNASVLGSAMGIATGMAPRAHLAAYKVCWKSEGRTRCSTLDITAAIDKAVSDGVDVISISIGFSRDPLDHDTMATSSFPVVKNGIFVPAGNDGQVATTVKNISPWVLTIGGSNNDRRIGAMVKLGSGYTLVGESAYQPSNNPDHFPFVLPQWNGDENSSYCTNLTTLRHAGVEDMVVECDAGINNKFVEKVKMVKEAGGMAVAEGVDVISPSLGPLPRPLYEDPMAISTFAAVKNGVFLTMSAGNDGPNYATVDNILPWVLTVGASTIDRRIRTVVKLGSGVSLEGESAYQPSNLSEYLPLVLPQWDGDENSSYCTNVTTLRHVGVEGMVVVCKDGINERVEKGKFVKEAGGAAMIICDNQAKGFDTHAVAHVIPASYLNYIDCLTLFKYMDSNLINPNATIEFLGTTVGDSSNPAVAAFSSRGPSNVNLGILKPDIIGPGVNILASWPSIPVGAFPINPPFNMASGTSVACPHLAGVAALLKSSHPDWSPAMIKSAIMTTADVTDLGGEPIHDSYDGSPASLFATGAGHVNPTRANNPGLVYDITTEDYIGYLCGLGYTVQQVRLIASIFTLECDNYIESDLNYPSMMAVLSNDNGYTARFRRTLTNVGRSHGIYTAYVARPFGVTMDVTPATLEFARTGEKQSFTVNFEINSTESVSDGSWSPGCLIWTSSESSTSVRSIIMLRFRR